MTIESRLAEIRARVESATPGPWENDETDPGVWGLEHIIIGNYTARDDFDSPMWEDGTPEDREFIAASRADLPALLAAVEAVMASIENGAWAEESTDFGPVSVVNADEIRAAITAALEAQG